MTTSGLRRELQQERGAILASGATVFAVHTDPRLANRIGRLAEGVGLSVRSFASAKAFLASCSPDTCGCLFLELKGDKLDDLAVVAQLARREVFLPAVVVTGEVGMASRAEIFARGACDIIQNPLREGPFYTSLWWAMANLLAARCGKETRPGDRDGALRAAFEELFAESTVGVGVVGSSGRLMTANPAFCRDLGYTSDQVSTKTIADVSHPEDYAREIRLITECLAGRRLSYRMIKRFKCCDGTIVRRWLTGTFIREAQRTWFGLGVMQPLSPGDDREGDAATSAQPATPAQREAAQSETKSCATTIAALELTEREQEVLDLILKGRNLKQIARILGVSVQAAWKRRRGVFKKCGVDNEVQLVMRMVGPK